MSRRNTEIGDVILYGGIILLAYYTLKSWDVISTTSAKKAAYINDSPKFNWKPLSEQELNNLKVENSQVNPYIDIDFYRRTERGRIGYGFVSK